MGNLSSTPSSTTTHGEYDVFLSFRGTDTRKSFTSHLYRALHEYEIKTFIDDNLIRGEEISEGLLSAIGESKISVIIFSEKYAFSRWCLRELAEIMKYEEMNKQIVIPVFYNVDPSHVRKQIGSYEAAFVKHDKNELEEEVQKWRGALTRASNLSGWDSSVARDESKLVCDIVRVVWNKLLNISPSFDFEDRFKDLVGIEKHIAGVVSKLCLEVPDFRIVGIWGMGGMGKTTIARAVIQIISHQFENRTYFTGSVRAESENGLIRLRNEILSKVLNIENQKSSNRSIPRRIEEMPKQKKVLIVLDDVDNIEQLKILAAGLVQFGPGSRIILTTRDTQVLRDCKVKDHNMYKVEGLNDDEALQLFCNHAFKLNHPEKDFEGLSREMVKIATTVPLAVTVLGSSLFEKSMQYWKDAVDQFQGIMNPTIFDRLKISYNGLHEEEKGLFLDIACFDAIEFAYGRDRPNLLSNRTCFLDRLIDKSLVTVEHGFCKMHDLLRDMGRKIVDEESPNKPGDRSRLWRQEDVLRTLKHNDGITNAVQGILLNLYNIEDKHLISQAIEKMYNLRTLIVKGAYTNDGLDYLPDELRYLHWKCYPLEVLSSRFNPVNLVELDLQSSKIKQLWKGKTQVPNLKRLDLSYCSNLISIPDLSDIPLAESINLESCTSLLAIHSSRERPKNLHSLKLSDCENLSTFPSNIRIEGSEFSLSGCISLTEFPRILGNIKRLEWRKSRVKEVPSTILNLSKLERLDMVKCKRLKHISESICQLKSLDRLDLRGCCILKSFPDSLEGMELKYLNLSRTAIEELPPSIGYLNRLEKLDLSDCISKREKLPPLSGLCSLKKLRLNRCNLTEISEDIGCLSTLEKLELAGNNFERLPESIKKLSKLYYLTLSDCGMLLSLPELPSSLLYLEAMNCKQLIQSLPDESEFVLCADGSGFLSLNFCNCQKLDQKAVRNLLRVSLVKMKLMGTEKIISLFKVSLPPLPPAFTPPGKEDEEVNVGIFLPGSKIPEKFRDKNNGSSINIRELRNDCARSRYIMGFAVCLVIGPRDDKIGLLQDPIYVHCDFHIETSDGHKEGNPFPLFRMPIKVHGFIESDHILVGYNLSSKCYEFFRELDTLLANRGMSDSVGISFKFSCAQDWYTVKRCGIHPIHVRSQVMNSVSINQDTGDTSGCHDAAQETCDPHPARSGCQDAAQETCEPHPTRIWLKIKSILHGIVGLCSSTTQADDIDTCSTSPTGTST